MVKPKVKSRQRGASSAAGGRAKRGGQETKSKDTTAAKRKSTKREPTSAQGVSKSGGKRQARSIKLTEAKRKMTDEKKRMAEKRKKKAEMKKRTAEKEKKKKTFQQDVKGKAHGLKAQERSDEKKGTSDTANENPHVEKFMEGLNNKLTSVVTQTIADVYRHYFILFKDGPPNERLPLNLVLRLVKVLEDKRRKNSHYIIRDMLRNIAADPSDETREEMKSSIIPRLLQQVQSNKDERQQRSMEIMGQMAGHRAENRDIVLDSGVLDHLLRIIENSKCEPTIAQALQLLAVLVKPEFPFPDVDKITSFLRPVSKHLEIRDHYYGKMRGAYSVLDAIAKGPCKHFVEFGESCEGSICKKLVGVCRGDDGDVHFAVLILAEIASGDDYQTNGVVQSGALAAFAPLLLREQERVSICTLMALSNILADSGEHLQAVIDVDIFPRVIAILGKEDLHVEGMRFAIRILKGALINGNDAQIRYIADTGAIVSICQVLLPKGNTDVLEDALTCLQILLRIGKDDAAQSGTVNRYDKIARDCGGLTNLNTLKTSQQGVELQQIICLILDEHFPEDKDEDDS